MQRDKDTDCITVIRVMSLPISSPSLLPALFNSLHSCLNNFSTTSVFNPALLTAINLATPAVITQQLPGRIYLKVPNFMVMPLPHAGFWFWGSVKLRCDTIWTRGLLDLRAGLQLPKHYTAISELRKKKKVKMEKKEQLPGSCSWTARAIKRLVFSHSKSTKAVLGKAWQEHALCLLRWILDDDISKFKMSAIKKSTD